MLVVVVHITKLVVAIYFNMVPVSVEVPTSIKMALVDGISITFGPLEGAYGPCRGRAAERGRAGDAEVNRIELAWQGGLVLQARMVAGRQPRRMRGAPAAAVELQEVGTQTSPEAATERASAEMEYEMQYLTVWQLQDLLRAHGSATAGTKRELIERARGVLSQRLDAWPAPTERQMDYMRDLERRLQRRMPLLAWSSRDEASAAITVAADELACRRR